MQQFMQWASAANVSASSFLLFPSFSSSSSFRSFKGNIFSNLYNYIPVLQLSKTLLPFVLQQVVLCLFWAPIGQSFSNFSHSSYTSWNNCFCKYRQDKPQTKSENELCLIKETKKKSKKALELREYHSLSSTASSFSINPKHSQ